MQEVTYLLFTTTTCPKCPAFKAWVSEFLDGYPGQVVDNTSPDFMDKAQTYGVTTAPTLILFDEAEGEIFRTDEISAIADYLADQRVS